MYLNLLCDAHFFFCRQSIEKETKSMAQRLKHAEAKMGEKQHNLRVLQHKEKVLAEERTAVLDQFTKKRQVRSSILLESI